MNKRLFVLALLFVFLSIGAYYNVSADDSADADAALDSGNYSLAKELYRKVFINTVDKDLQAKAVLGLAKVDYALKNYYEAGINLKRFFKNYPNSPLSNEARLLWGLSYLKIRKYKEAGEQLDLVSGDLLQRAYMAKAELAMLKGDIQEAEGFLSKLDGNLYENNYRVLFIRSTILSQQGKHAEAVKLINKIPEPVLKSEDISVNKAIIYYNARRYIDAKDMLMRIVKEPSSRIESMQAKKTLFKIYELENNDDAALSLGIELLDYDSSDAMKMKVASIYEKRGDVDNALKYLSGIRDKKIQGAEIEKRLRKLTEERNPRLDEYIAKFFIYIDPDSRYNIELSRYMADKGNKELSTRMLQRALKGRSGSEAAILLAEQLVAEKKYNEAKKIVQPVTTDANFSGQANLLMSLILEGLGDNQGSENFRKKAIGILLLQKDYYRVADLYIKDGNRSEALKNYQKAADKGNVDAMVKAADLLYINGKTGLAKTYYKKALDTGKKDQKLIQWAAYQYGKLANDDEFMEKAKAGGGVVAESAELMKSLR